MRKKIDKSIRHDYATISDKVSNKIRTTFYKIIKDRTKAYPFYRSYRHRNVKGKKNSAGTSHYMTERPNNLAGFGHGLGSWRAGLVNADRLGIKYAYSPMVNSSWDEKMGLGEGLKWAEDLIRSGYKKVRLPYYDMNSKESVALIKRIIDSYSGEKVVFYNEHEQWTADGDDIYGDLLIRDLFWKSGARKKDFLVYSNKSNNLNVALHIRRGDVKALLEQGDESMLARWLDISYYANVMKTILKISENSQMVHFYLFSEGDKSQFDELFSITDNLKILTDLSAEDSFINLCHADIIVTAPSSFSIIAGAFSYGLKLYPDKDWLTIPDTNEWQKIYCDGTATKEAVSEIKKIIKKRNV
ncbi:MAG: hypothetical protein IJR29_09025 [Butyrivibrio sp.]|nr:hypothetical protein [Butyrivibrio sp.]